MYRKFLLVLVAFSLAGCVGGEPDPLPPDQAGAPAPASPPNPSAPGVETPAPGSPSADGAATPAAPAPFAAPAIPVDAQAPQQPVATSPQPAAGTPQPAPAPAPGVKRVVAQAGVGKKGSRYGGGIITQPISTYFTTRDRFVFEMQIAPALKLFRATHDRYPKDMAEFEKEILKPGNITLPRLPDGERYVYDPTVIDLPNKNTGLMVEIPQ